MRTVYQLTEEEFQELTERHIIENDITEEITANQITDYYSGTSFVKEDFFCNL
jgi:hypothetical protein